MKYDHLYTQIHRDHSKKEVSKVAILPVDIGKQAAVLIPIIKKAEPELLFTLRSSTLASHAGQVSFPGGMRENSDKTLIQTALRESQEEINLTPNSVEIIGELETVTSHLGVKVTPYIGLIEENLPLEKNPAEVEAIFTVPLNFFLTAHNLQKREIMHQNTLVSTPAFYYQEYEIWGLTAIMMMNFLEKLTIKR